MKKTHSRFVLAVLVALLVAATCISVFSVSVSAETKNGITAMLSTDKVSYAESDPVKVTLNVTNQSGKQAVVTTTVTAPEGWIGVSGQAVNTMTLESGDTNTGELVLQAKKMGGTGPLVLILIIVLVIILALLVVFLVVKKKKGRLAISVFLCVILAGVLVLSTVPAQAAGAADTLTVSKTVTVGDESVTITATVEFTLNNEVVDDGVYTRQELEDALMATAWAYYMKGSKMQYCSEEITLGLNKYTGGNYRLTEDAAPEFGTADSTIYSVCSDFVYKMYYEALGHRMFGAENYLGATTSDFWLKSASVELVRWFHPSYELKEIDTKYGVTKDKAMTTDEVISFLGGWKQNLRPGDVLVVTGHAMVYVGNGYILDCWGSKYDMALGLEQKEYSGAVHVLHKIEDVLIQGDDPVSGSEYKISDDSTKDYLVIFRPLDAFVSEKSSADTGNDIIDLAAMSEDTSKYTSAISRIEYPGMEIDRTVDAGPYGAVATGNVLTYNVKVSNLSDDANYILYRRGRVKGYAGEGYTDLVITETVPEGTELVEGSITGGGVCKDGVITWTVDIEAGSSVEVSYAVKVTAKRGESIVNDGGKVDEIASNKLVSTVSGSGLSDIALKGLSGLAATEKTSWRETYNISKLGTDLEFAERVYQSAMGIGLELPTAQEVLDNLFTYQTVENESCSDRYPNSMRANLYVLNEEVEGQWQALADMLVEGYYGGRKLYSEDRNLTINEFKASYLQPGDILVYASTADADGSVTASRVMVYAGKNSDGNAVLLSLISDQISRVFVGSTNNNADELHTILWKALTEDVFFVLRPTQAYDDINTLTYEKANEPTYGDEPAERKEGLQIGPDYSTELSEEYVFNLAGLNAAGWKNYNTAFIEEVYQAIGLDISSGTKGTTIKNMLNGNIFFHSVGTSTNCNYELQAVASAEMERLSSMMVPGLRGGPDMVGYTDNLISLKDLQPGDTINMVQLQRGIMWVGVYLGDGKVLVSQYATNAPSGKYQTYQVYDFGTDTDGSTFAEFLTKDDIDGVKWNCYFVTRPSWGFEDINDNPYDGNSSISYVSGLKGFEQVQSMDDIEDGYYVIVVKYNSKYYFMTNEADESRVQFSAATANVSGSAITAGNLQYWCIDVNTRRSSGYDVYISNADGYLYQKAQDTASLDVTNSTGTDGASWCLRSDGAGHFTLTNSGTGARMLMLSTQHSSFKAYSAGSDSRYPELLLFKYTGSSSSAKAVLADGKYNVIVKVGSKYYAMTDVYNEELCCLNAVEVTLTNGVFTGEDMTAWTVTNAGAGDSHTFVSPDGQYLTRNAWSANMKLSDSAVTWTVTKSGSNYTIFNSVEDDALRYLAYNGTGFKAYEAAREDRIIEMMIVPAAESSGSEPTKPVVADGEYNVIVKVGSKYYAMADVYNEELGCMSAVEVTLVDGIFTGANMSAWTVSNAGAKNSFTFMTSDGKYLSRNTWSANMKLGDSATAWTVTKSGSNCTISNSVEDDTLRYLAYNGTGFKAYEAAREDRIIELLLVPVGGTVPDDSTGDNSGDEGGDTPVTPEPVEPVIVDGNYNVVIKYGDVYYAMTSTFDETNGCLAAVEVTLTDGTVTSGNPTDWIITNGDNGNVTLMAPDGKYLIRSSGGANINVGTDAENWMLVKNEIGGTYTLQNTNNDSRYLAYNGTGFKAYAAAREDRIIELLLVPVGGTVPDDSTGDNSGDEGGDTPVTPENLSDISGNYVISYYDADAGKYKVMSSTVAGDVVAFVEATSLQTSDLPVWTIRMTASSQTDRTVTLQNDKGEYLAHSGASMYVQATSFCWTVTEDDNGNYRFFHNDGSLTRYLMFTSANSGFKAYTDNTDDRKDPLTVQKVSDLDDIQPTTYTQVISASDVTNGDYLVVVAYRGKYYLMTQTLNASAVALTAIGCEVTDGTIVTYVEAFTFTKTENGFTLAVGEQYVNNSAGSANLALNDTQMVWTVSADGDVFNLTSNGRLLMYSEDNAGFKSYAADKDDAEGAKFTSQLLLFKK